MDMEGLGCVQLQRFSDENLTEGTFNKYTVTIITSLCNEHHGHLQASPRGEKLQACEHEIFCK